MLTLTVFLAALMLLSTQLRAGQESPEVAVEAANAVDDCPPVREAKAEDNESEKSDEAPPGDRDCVTAAADPLPDENRQNISSDVAENTQDALSLRRLLLGRSYSFFGRVEADYAAYPDGVLKDDDGSDLRRLRVGLVGVLSDNLSYKSELDLTDGTNNLSDFYLKWDTSRFGSLILGNQRVAQNLSAMTGSLSQLFMEDPLPASAFSLARRLAIGHDFYLRKFGVHTVFFTRDPNNEAGKHGAAIRVIANPVRSDGGIAHVGFSLVREKIDREIRYRTRPESHVTDIRLVDTGQFNDVRYQNTLGVELAGALGSLSGRIEGFARRWEREDAMENDFFGAYIEIGHFLTGQEFQYRNGKFVRPRIEKGSQAWEVGFRSSWVDLNDEDVRGGEQWNLGLALNYYYRQNIRVMFNVIRYDAERDEGDEDGWIAQARIQYNW
jgi:phosphate-selective porin OprO/OprP